MKTKLLILVCVIFITAVAGVVWVTISGWPPIIIRNSEYRKLISDFQQAQLSPRVKSDKDMNSDMGWDFQIQVPEKQTTAKIQASGHLGVVRIQYKDENNPSRLYESVDYSNVWEIRTAGNILYVCWTEALISNECWLLAYDLTDRRQIVRRKIDPQDLQKTY